MERGAGAGVGNLSLQAGRAPELAGGVEDDLYGGGGLLFGRHDEEELLGVGGGEVAVASGFGEDLFEEWLGGAGVELGGGGGDVDGGERVAAEVEELLAVAAPFGFGTALGGDEPFAAGGGTGGVEGADVDLVAAGLIGAVGDPAAIGGNTPHILAKLRGEQGRGAAAGGECSRKCKHGQIGQIPIA